MDILNTTGDKMAAYGYVVICFCIVLSAVVLSALNPAVNDISDDFSAQITAGTVSEQTAGHYDNATRIFKYILPMSIMGLCIIYGITRAQTEGE